MKIFVAPIDLMFSTWLVGSNNLATPTKLAGVTSLAKLVKLVILNLLAGAAKPRDS